MNNLNTDSFIIFYGGNIITMNGDSPVYVESLVQKNGKIVFLGTKDDGKNKYPSALHFDLKGATMFPGFVEPHSHFMAALKLANHVDISSPPVGDVRNINDLLNKLAEHKNKNDIKEGDWVVGYGYDHTLLEEHRHLTRHDIDKVLPNHNVLIIHVSMHGAVLNSKALTFAGFDKNTKDIEGGFIAREPDGSPAGLLMELAWLKIFASMPQPNEDEMIELLKDAQMLYASNGYTQAMEGFTHISEMDMLQRGASENKLFLDIISLPGFSEIDQWLNNPKYPLNSYNNNLKFAGGKFTLDGSPQGKTAFMKDPYLTNGPDGEKNWHGTSIISTEQLITLAKPLVDSGVQLHIHATGSGAIDSAITAVESLGLTADDDKRTIVIHSQFQDKEQLNKYVKLGMSPSYFTNHIFFWGDVHIENMGLEISSFLNPIKSAKNLGLKFSNHGDYNVTPLDPFFMLWTSVNRLTRDNKVLGSDERIDVYTALQGLTTGPAWQFFEENRKGMLKEGLLADFVIVENNPLTQDVLDLKNNKVLFTIKEGNVVYEG